ncbi:hypothetical protein DV735_g3855, partial [Chaetothyriales sp. CBS 134920]
MAAASVSLGTSNLRGSGRQTRTNPTRTSKTAATALRQNSLAASNTGLGVGPAAQGTSQQQHGFYPAIQHFTDAIAALPRDYRRHVSLLKEVDAKAWNLEADLQQLLTQCIAYTSSSPLGTPVARQTDQGRPSAQAPAPLLPSAASSSNAKNHVINNANEELSRHLRRLHTVWPHLANEVSEEAMYGSLKHWAYTDTNPTKKGAATSRRDAAAHAAHQHESDAAHRSESRREAVAAKSKRNPGRIEPGFGEVSHSISKKTAAAEKRAAEKRSAAEAVEDLSGLGITGTFRGKKAKAAHAALGAGAMSREPSQQDGGKKRKASAATTATARKRLNANQDSPKLPPAPLPGALAKEPYKRSPALSAARLANSAARQTSAQTNDNSSSRGRPQSVSARNGGVSASSVEQLQAPVGTTAAGKTANEAKSTAKESASSKAVVEDEGAKGAENEAPARASAALERTASKQGGTKDVDDSAKPADSPRLGGSAPASRGRTAKVGTPVMGGLGDADLPGMAENGNSKSKRAARPRVKDHGLHDSLSPKGLPLKRSHKKGASMASQPSQQSHQRVKADAEVVAGAEEYSEEPIDDPLEDEKYCYCNGPSYGEMIACDNPKCPGEWFHLECIGLKNAPKSEKWFCEDCKEKVVVGKRSGNGR